MVITSKLSASDLREFLTTRRGRLTPEQAGLPVYGTNRRVTGLRREEVALLAGISVDYYARLEGGGLASVPHDVVDGLVHALQLDETERDQLELLVRMTTRSVRRAPPRHAARQPVRPAVQRILDLLPTPAYVRNERFDVLAANDPGRALYSPLHDQTDRGEQPNLARAMFLAPAAETFWTDYDRVLDDCIASLRADAGHDPYNKGLFDLVAELSTDSDDFRRRWSAHDIRRDRTGRIRLRHPLAGDLQLDIETFDLPHEIGLRLTIYTAPADSPSQRAFELLATDQ